MGGATYVITNESLNRVFAHGKETFAMRKCNEMHLRREGGVPPTNSSYPRLAKK